MGVDISFRHKSGPGGFVMFIEELGGSSGVPLDENL